MHTPAPVNCVCGLVDLDPMSGSGLGRSARVLGGGWWLAKMVMMVNGLVMVAQLIVHSDIN